VGVVVGIVGFGLGVNEGDGTAFPVVFGAPLLLLLVWPFQISERVVSYLVALAIALGLVLVGAAGYST